MGKGKKKGQKGGDGPSETPSVSGLSISEDAPSTSQPVEEEVEGLGVGSRKKNRKLKQAEAKAAAAKPKEELPQESQPEEPKIEQKPESVELSEPKLEVKKEESKEEPKEEESEGLGLGLGGGKKRPRKKPAKKAAATQAEAKAQPSTLQPGPAYPAPQTGWGPSQGEMAQGHSTGMPPQGFQAPGPQTWQAMPTPPFGAPTPASAMPTPAPGTWQTAVPPAVQQRQPFPPKISAVPSTTEGSRANPPRATPPRATLSRGELSTRFKIPTKVLGSGRVMHTRTKVITNYLPMTFKAIKVYRYDVIIKPDKPKKMMPAAFKLAIQTHYPQNPYIAFDQVKNCYTLTQFKDVPADGSSRSAIQVDLDDSNGRKMRFEVSFKATGVVDLTKLKQHMESGGSSLSTPSEEIQCIDVILRQGALEAYVKCGRQFFKRPNKPLDLSGGLEMWTGLFQSAIFTSSAFINIDVVHKGFPMQQNLIDAIRNSFKLATDRKIEDQRSREVENFIGFIKGLRVVATLVGPPNNGQTREFTCNGLADVPSKLSFTCEKDGKKFTMTVAEYFAKDKGYKIKYPNLNCMHVGPRDKNIYYPMELLQVSYGQPRNRQLNEYQLSNMVREAAAPPFERKRKIEEVAACMNYSSNTFFKKFGLEISNKFLEVEAKVLAPPSLDCGERNSIVPRKGQWQSNRLVKPEALESWGFVSIDTDINTCNYETIKNMLMTSGRQMGMVVTEPKMTFFNVKMTELRNILFSAVEKHVRFIFIIVSARGRDYYHRIKQLAERDVGILTQCIKENTATRRMNMQTIKNILLKVNSKLMGINQLLDTRSMPNCLKGGDVMVVGADVTHPSPDQTSIPSIAAVAASMDSKCFSFGIHLSIQTPKKEMIIEFADMMYDHLKYWRERHHSLPKKVYVFRDGVSEGQFAEVMNSELTAVHRAFERFNAPKPEILFLLVQKRHHTRFFTTQRCENVEPGTVVDTHIVHPKELDFYLVSHQAIKGTARPTRYHAICNDGNMSHEEVEQLTYYLCHLYSRCMRAVSYPTPTYYAHLACFRARSLTYGQVFDNAALEHKPERLYVLERILNTSRMFYV